MEGAVLKGTVLATKEIIDTAGIDDLAGKGAIVGRVGEIIRTEPHFNPFQHALEDRGVTANRNALIAVVEVVVVEGEVVNRKITSPEDLEWAVAHANRLLAGEI